MIQARGGFVSGVDDFDPKFFNISPKEAAYVDPQHRLLLECAWKALEYGEHRPDRRSATATAACTSASASSTSASWSRDSTWPTLEANMGPGTAHSAACGRLSYFLGWRGPCICVDTACSASLVALHLAVQGLRRGECSIALAAGSTRCTTRAITSSSRRRNMLAPDGRCKTFDESADGYAPQRGLRACWCSSGSRTRSATATASSRWSAARRSRQDGESGGLTVPNGTAQESR